MKHFKTIQAVALVAILCGQSFSLAREKRSFSWPSFFGGGASTDVAEVEQPEVESTVQDSQVLPQQHVEIPIQHLSPGYHYPIWRVHKYNGIELKPMPISLVPQQHAQQIHLQQLHTQVPYTQLQQRQQFHQIQPTQLHAQSFQSGATQQTQSGQQVTNSNCKAKAAPIPPELQELADQFGIKDVSKLPSLEDAMGLLGTTTRAETIQTIKELASTADGMNLIRQFLASDEGVAASEDPNNQCNNDALSTQQSNSQQPPNNFNVPNRQISLPHTNVHHGFSAPYQQYGVPRPYPAQQHDVYGLPNAHQANSFKGVEVPAQEYNVPNSHIMSLVKNEAAPHEEYGIPNELSTAHSEHQGYNEPQQNIGTSQQGHEIYGLPNTNRAVAFQQEYYAPRSSFESAKSEEIPHREYNVPNEESSGASVQEPHQEYGVPINEESSGASVQEPQQEYGVPTNEESSGASVQEPQQEYGLPINEESSAASVEEPHQEYGVPINEQSAQQHEVYGLPNVQDPLNFHSQGLYPPKTEQVESEKSDAIVPHREYNVPNEQRSNHKTQVPHEVYGVPSDLQTLPNTDNNLLFSNPHEVYAIPEPDQNVLTPHETYGVAKQENENVQQDQQDFSHLLPSVADTQASITAQNNSPHLSYALPHQRFFDSPNVFGQPQSQQSTQYGAPTKFDSKNHRAYVPLIRQIDGSLDRAHTNLQLGQLLTTTVRPDAGFLERIGAWTKYFTPPGPTVPIVSPQVTEDVDESADNSQDAYTIPIPKIPELNEAQLYGLPATHQLPNVYIPKKFIMNPTLNQGPFVRVQHPLSDFSSQMDNHDYGLPHQQPEPFDGQTVDEFVPDISQLPLEQHNLGNNLRTSYGIPTNPHSYADDSSPAETNEQHVAVVLPNRSGRFGNRIDNVENEVVDEKSQKKFGPQRISSYDSYATGKLNRANDDAIIRLIPTQKPSSYSNQARRIGQVEEASIIDSIATMTSGFHPIT